MFDDGIKSEVIDKIWQDLVLMLVDETFKRAEQVKNSKLNILLERKRSMGLELLTNQKDWIYR